ncbi:MAG: hypothetical protein IMF11_00120 [Proteobacteria bacterium]|nr:hypothetical protein [Pseudomonadota bacterium]
MSPNIRTDSKERLAKKDHNYYFSSDHIKGCFCSSRACPERFDLKGLSRLALIPLLAGEVKGLT